MVGGASSALRAKLAGAVSLISASLRLRDKVPERLRGRREAIAGPGMGLLGWGCCLRGMPHAPPGETKRSRATGGGAEAMGERCNSFSSSENLDLRLSMSLWGGGKTDQARGGPGSRPPGDGGIQRPTSNRQRCAGSGALKHLGGGPGSRNVTATAQKGGIRTINAGRTVAGRDTS